MIIVLAAVSLVGLYCAKFCQLQHMRLSDKSDKYLTQKMGHILKGFYFSDEFIEGGTPELVFIKLMLHCIYCMTFCHGCIYYVLCTFYYFHIFYIKNCFCII